MTETTVNVLLKLQASGFFGSRTPLGFRCQGSWLEAPTHLNWPQTREVTGLSSQLAFLIRRHSPAGQQTPKVSNIENYATQRSCNIKFTKMSFNCKGLRCCVACACKSKVTGHLYPLTTYERQTRAQPRPRQDVDVNVQAIVASEVLKQTMRPV